MVPPSLQRAPLNLSFGGSFEPALIYVWPDGPSNAVQTSSNTAMFTSWLLQAVDVSLLSGDWTCLGKRLSLGRRFRSWMVRT